MPRDPIAPYRRQVLSAPRKQSSKLFDLACLPASTTSRQWALIHLSVLPLTMPHEVLVGGSCYTASEAQKLLDRINKQAGGASVQAVRGNWLYYVDLKQGQSGLDKVKQLLQLPSDSTNRAFELSNSSDNETLLYITPRNISPWSSKATSIAHVCGLKEQVHRVERGRVVTIEFAPSAASHDQADLPFRDLIHDRMTESITSEQPSLDLMFIEGERSPLVVVDIFAAAEEPLSVLQDYNQKMGLALSQEEMEYLVDVYTKLGRPPHDVELFMFAQVNSEYVSLLAWCATMSPALICPCLTTFRCLEWVMRLTLTFCS